MDKKILKAAVDTMRDLGLSEIRIKDSETEIILKREIKEQAQTQIPVYQPVNTVPAADAAGEYSEIPDEVKSGKQESKFHNSSEIKSPLIGVFYDSPSPEAVPFVKVGDKVKKGDTVCIIEAMKMMNEINAECDGVVMDICAENGDLVEYGQTLFIISGEDNK